MSVTLLLGGARSGKSRRAEALAAGHVGPVLYVATALRIQGDSEWEARIEAHRRRRPQGWRTLEVPHALSACLREHGASRDDLILVDCLSVWLSNRLLAEADLELEVESLIEALRAVRCPLILVSNEVGLGVVPPTSLGRRFRDAQGMLNQQLAEHAERVELWVAGLPWVLKPGPSAGTLGR